MQTKKSPEHTGELVHGHSRLLWLIDEVDAHLRGLWEPDDENVEPILEELLSYWDTLRAELGAHMDHEEHDVFQTVDRVAPQFAAQVSVLRAQHANLDKELQVLDGALRDLASPAGRSLASGALRRAVERFREHFVAHSRDERGVLREIEGAGIALGHPG